jgi:hypothetical protein
MSFTPRQLITDVLLDLGVYGTAEAVEADHITRGLRKLNNLLDSLSLNRLWLRHVEVVEKALAAGTASYTLGTGGSINTPRPSLPFEGAGLVLDDTVDDPIEKPIRIYSDDEWRAIRIKTQTSDLVQGIYPDYQFDYTALDPNSLTLMTVYVGPIPTGSDSRLRLYLAGNAVPRFSDLPGSVYHAPLGYERALHYLLARELAPVHHVPLPPLMEALAAQALEAVEDSNHREHLLRADEVTALARGARAGSAYGGFDIRTGESS